MDPQQLISDGTKFAEKAIFHDQAGQYGVAQFFYIEASEAILKAIALDTSLLSLKNKALQYIERGETLQSLVSNSPAETLQRHLSQSESQKEVEQIEFLLVQAMSEDENGSPQTALPLYTDVVELCLEKSKKISDPLTKEKLRKWTTGALGRAEAIKSGNRSRSETRTAAASTVQMPAVNRLSLKHVPDGKPKLSKKEIETLRHTSHVNNRVFPPWMHVDLNERFAYRIPFSDPGGNLALAPKQKSKFASWVRPSDICQDPKMIYAVSSFSIKQTIVSDCSFVASLAISAAYERQFKKRLITSIIYPQKKDGTPMINPCGKYMVKLKFNGVARKVIIDDKLPLGKNNQLLCSFSQNEDEFWVSLLEKAYMKVMGGYDFPGSNSNIDLNTLTGWIPERASLKSEDVNHDVLFDRLVSGLEKGDVLVTAATGMLSDTDAERAGLVPTHAYAVLDVKKVQGKRLCQLKNPWSHLRWKGKYSDTDSESWTPELERILRYNHVKAAQNDNGVFWINWESLRRFYDVIYMNWNPKLFPYKFTYHSKWQAAEGPVKDAYNIGDNPQYRLEVQAGNEGCVLWILLTRHITERDDFAENKEFITLHVYKSDGRRIFYPDNRFIEGTKINSPHYLCKMKPPAGTSKYTVVLSQYEKMNTIYYSLKVHSTAKFHLSPVPEVYTSKKKITVSWTKHTAGGCANFSTYESNPKIPLELISSTPSQVLIKLEASRKYAAGIELRSIDGKYKKTSGDSRWGFVAFDIKDVPEGKYLIIPSTFSQGQEGPFFLEVQASCAFKLNVA